MSYVYFENQQPHLRRVRSVLNNYRTLSLSKTNTYHLDTNTIPFGQPNLIQNANYLLALKEARGAGLSPISKMDSSNSSSTPDFVTPVIPMKRRKRKSTSVPSSSQSSVTKRVTKRVKTQHETKTKTELVKVNDHVQKHNDEKKSYTCNYPDCGKQFATTSDLKVHQRSHGEIFNHYCQFCKRGFNHKAMWQVHTRTHTGEKPYGCKFCDMRFSDKSNMRRHVRRRHQPSNK